MCILDIDKTRTHTHCNTYIVAQLQQSWCQIAISDLILHFQIGQAIGYKIT